jgi:hypothetical protein
VAGLRIRQYTYFAVKSRDLSAKEIERRLGISADRLRVAGSEGEEPLRPAAHSWELVCERASLTVDEQIANVVARLQPARAALRALTAAGEVSAVLQVVRYFDDESGEEENVTRSAAGTERLLGQHQLLGWHLDLDTIGFLAAVRADLDVDEYG